LSWPGRACASAISSFTDFTGSDGCTTSTFGAPMASDTGAKSAKGSQFTRVSSGCSHTTAP